MSGEASLVQQGSLYASLHRLTREGWIPSAWRETELGRRARYYASPGGRRGSSRLSRPLEPGVGWCDAHRHR